MFTSEFRLDCSAYSNRLFIAFLIVGIRFGRAQGYTPAFGCIKENNQKTKKSGNSERVERSLPFGFQSKRTLYPYSQSGNLSQLCGMVEFILCGILFVF